MVDSNPRLKSLIENAGDDWMARCGWRRQGGSQIENAREERMGRDGWRKDR